MIELVGIFNAKQSLLNCNWKFEDIKLSKSDKDFIKEIKKRKDKIEGTYAPPITELNELVPALVNLR